MPYMALGKKIANKIASVAQLATTPLLPGDYLDYVAPLRPGAALRGRIVAKRPHTTNASTIVVQPGADWLGFIPGQYVKIGVDVRGVRHWRTFSVSGSTSDNTIDLTVKAHKGSVVADWLIRRAGIGDIIQLSQAEGGFVLPVTAPAKALFIAGGSGITPIASILRNHRDELRDAVLVYANMTADDVILAGSIRALAREGAITLIELFTDRDGLLTPDVLAQLVPDYRERETWACGPAGLLDTVQDHWEEHDMTHLLHTERFRLEPVVIAEGGTVTFAVSDKVMAVAGGTPLLVAGENIGVDMPSGCRMGVCYGCVSTLSSGAVRDVRTGDIIEAEAAAVTFQPCVSAAAGDCTIDR